MSRFAVVRNSKFRHIYCDPPKPDNTFTDLRLSSATGDQTYIKTNGKYFAIAVQGGGGPFAVLPLESPGRYQSKQPVFNGHSGAVLDFDFHPFNQSLIASCSEDQAIKLWSIPDGGLTSTIHDSIQDMKGHNRRVTLLRFNPTAENVLASVSKDNEIKIWDVSNGSEIASNKQSKDLIQDIVWDYSGKCFATSTKDKAVSIYDPRGATEAVQTISQAHEGSKAVKLTFLGGTGQLLSVGFTRTSQRQFKIWDPRNVDKALHTVDIDQASGAIIPYFDEDTSVLYLAGKGDGNIRYYEVTSSKPYVYPIADFRSSVPSKGMAWVPKRFLNITKCETARMLKLTTNSVEPLSFIVPRKSVDFQDDIFPDTLAGVPSMSCAEWRNGSDKGPMKMSLDPSKKNVPPYPVDVGASASSAIAPAPTPAPARAPAPAPAPVAVPAPVTAAVAETPVATPAAVVQPEMANLPPTPEPEKTAVQKVKESRPTSAPGAFSFVPEKTTQELLGDLARANARIQELEMRLFEAGLSTD
jgi:coronin-1B/1C/6